MSSSSKMTESGLQLCRALCTGDHVEAEKQLHSVTLQDLRGDSVAVTLARYFAIDLLVKYMLAKTLPEVEKGRVAIAVYTKAWSVADKSSVAAAYVTLVSHGINFPQGACLENIRSVVSRHASEDIKASSDYQSYLRLFAVDDGSDDESERRGSRPSAGAGPGFGTKELDPADELAAGNCGLRRRT